MNYGEFKRKSPRNSAMDLLGDLGFIEPHDIDEKRHPEEENTDPEEFIKMNNEKDEGDSDRTSKNPNQKTIKKEF